MILAVFARTGSIRLPETEDDLEPEPANLWHSYARHEGGGPCSHYVGDYRTALIEAMRYKRSYGARVHMERVS